MRGRRVGRGRALQGVGGEVCAGCVQGRGGQDYGWRPRAGSVRERALARPVRALRGFGRCRLGSGCEVECP
jgi:hypothetical protein